MWTKLRAAIPGGDSADSADDKPHESHQQGKAHWVVRGEARDDVAADDAIDGAIRGGEEEKPARHRLAQRREQSRGVKNGVGAHRENDHG